MSRNHGDKVWVLAFVEHANDERVKVWVQTKFGRQLAIVDPSNVIEEPPEAAPVKG